MLNLRKGSTEQELAGFFATLEEQPSGQRDTHPRGLQQGSQAAVGKGVSCVESGRYRDLSIRLGNAVVARLSRLRRRWDNAALTKRLGAGRFLRPAT